jgi:hypothetical protein
MGLGIAGLSKGVNLMTRKTIKGIEDEIALASKIKKENIKIDNKKDNSNKHI